MALAAATKRLLANWNRGLQALQGALTHRDGPASATLYGDAWTNGDRPAIPQADFPAGLPSWMHENDGWARRTGKSTEEKRRTITITAPKQVLP